MSKSTLKIRLHPFTEASGASVAGNTSELNGQDSTPVSFGVRIIEALLNLTILALLPLFLPSCVTSSDGVCGTAGRQTKTLVSQSTDMDAFLSSLDFEWSTRGGQGEPAYLDALKHE